MWRARCESKPMRCSRQPARCKSATSTSRPCHPDAYWILNCWAWHPAAIKPAALSVQVYWNGPNTSMMLSFTTILERIMIVCPLGIRFWDAALDRPVEDGLVVVAWPAEHPAASTRAILTASGVYAFHGLPGLRSFEYPDAGQPPASPPPARRFVVAVDDRLGRFVPVVFQVDLPYLGIFPTESGSSPDGRPPGFYLFASANSQATAGLAVLRADLVDSSGAEAAH